MNSPQTFAHNNEAYLPELNTSPSGIISTASNMPTIIPNHTANWNEIAGAFNFHNRKTGAKPITMVPLTVVADRISGLKKTGMVPSNTMSTIIHLPRLTVGNFSFPRSITTNFENELNVESNVEAAEVIMIKLIVNKPVNPINLATSTGACPTNPFAEA